ncbi:helix-turn-helix domain-containing protein [Caldimonas sp.]|uniref:helix-turn-helix domain-containing protein n=1 Tax=Caldimonas sp. TaxID=2838790 RepID=UPI003919B113
MDDPLQPDAEQILDAALVLGERLGWEALHLHDLAQALGVGLPAIYRHYDDKDALAEAWFDRADCALLAAGEAPGWGGAAGARPPGACPVGLAAGPGPAPPAQRCDAALQAADRSPAPAGPGRAAREPHRAVVA